MVDEEKVLQFARKWKMQHIETCAITGDNVKETFELLTKTILRRGVLSCSLFGSIPPQYVPGEGELNKFGIVRMINTPVQAVHNQAETEPEQKQNTKCLVS
eukprot:TRINITY_DN22018_c0_g1_i1.p1 TRINITY_DN22018_c0_g1~~TRINITY_DN22018_c0_g1_i1.p1  ORF type:complete len:101 (+),score=27.73 TRINITY_DN22018_c0_g1_i1:116-418(+)